ncbi:MAG: GNAT family N-acetyltransferase [Deltaproteobacteria bacterium]|nr:MAG: GNAT family N-acetyltransferase [Deltaproteobacteria bacterium]
MGTFSLSEVKVRPLTKEDLEAIVEIDAKVLGDKRPEYWRQKVQEGIRGPVKSLVVEYEGRVVGFILGTVSGWEFGVPSSFGWIDTIGVDPDFQGKGIGKLLFDKLVKEFSKQGIKKIYTLVNWNDWDLLSFFKAVGFTRGELINLEYDVKD